MFTFLCFCVYYNRLCDICQSFCFYLFKKKKKMSDTQSLHNDFMLHHAFHLFLDFCIRHFAMLRELFLYRV